MQNSDPAQHFLSEINGDFKYKDDTRPIYTARLVTYPEVGSNEWWSTTNLPTTIQWLAHQVLSLQLVSFQDFELAHNCINLGANAVYGLFQMQNTLQEAGEDMKNLYNFYSCDER